jgi:putative transposase
MPIIAVTSDEERLLMRKEAQQTLDKNHARRLIAMLMLHQGMTVTDVARTLCAARSSVGRLRIFLSSCPCWYNVPHRILAGFSLAGARSCWLASSTGFLAWFSTPPTLHRSLKMAGIIWRKAAPTLMINDPHYEKKRLAIRLALARKQTEHPVFYQEEVDINLNPKIGADWMRKGQQKRIATPGQNQKHYLAGALYSDTEKSTTSAAAVKFLICLADR